MTEQEQLQETFDRVKKHLRRQGRRAHELCGCSYRAKDGTKCAVGCLIPDENYSRYMEGKPVPRLFEYFPNALGREAGEREQELLKSLQLVHDHAAQNWPKGSGARNQLRLELIKVATRFGLKP